MRSFLFLIDDDSRRCMRSNKGCIKIRKIKVKKWETFCIERHERERERTRERERERERLWNGTHSWDKSKVRNV